MLKHINPNELIPPPGGIYSHVVASDTNVYISGQLGRDRFGEMPEDAASQYRLAWSNIQTALSAAGIGVDDLAKTTTYVAGQENIAAIRAAREELGLKTPPTSTMIVVAGLAAPGALVEIDAIAVIPRDVLLSPTGEVV